MYKEKFEIDSLENIVEEIVFRELYLLKKENKVEFCQCKICLQDIAAIVLNTVPPVYQNSEKFLPPNTDKIDMEKFPQILRQLLMVAIEKVKDAPHH